MEILKPTKLYFWFVQFLDGFVINQFDKDGTEIQQKEIADPSIVLGIDADGKQYYKPNVNYFTKVESEHGRMVKIGWIPFSKDLAKKAMEKSSTVSAAYQKDLPTLVKEIPQDYFGFVMQNTFIDVLKSDGTPISARVGRLILNIIPRNGYSTEFAGNYVINLKEVAPSGKSNN